MQVSNQMNPYASMNAYQQPVEVRSAAVTLPSTPIVEPKPELSPEEQLKQDREKQAKLDSLAAESEAKKDAQREAAVGFIAHESIKTQAEIYLSVAAESKVDLGGSSVVDGIATLRDLQKQNNAVAAYATYQENQAGTKPELY